MYKINTLFDRQLRNWLPILPSQRRTFNRSIAQILVWKPNLQREENRSTPRKTLALGVRLRSTNLSLRAEPRTRSRVVERVGGATDDDSPKPWHQQKAGLFSLFRSFNNWLQWIWVLILYDFFHYTKSEYIHVTVLRERILLYEIHREYFMESACVRFLFTSREVS